MPRKVWQHRGLSDFTSPLMTQALGTWDRLNAKLALAPSVSPLAPLGGFLWWPPGEQITFLGPWLEDGSTSCGKLLQDGKLIRLETLREQSGSFPMDFWRYRQLHHFFVTHGGSIRDVSTLTPFECLFIAEEMILHMISELYCLISSKASTLKPTFVRSCERDLETVFTPTQLWHLYQLTRSSSIDYKTQETNYKILSRW